MTSRTIRTAHARRKPSAKSLEAEDERVRRSKSTVLATAFQILSEAGLGAFSIDEVSRRSGVAKMTIYRHWPSRSALLLDACSQMSSSRAEPPDTGNFAADLMALTKGLAASMQSARWSSLLPSIIDAAERDPQLAELHAKQHATLTSSFRAIVERAKTRKQLSPRTDPSAVVALVMGPLVYRRWFSREKIDDAFVALIVKSALQTVARPAN